MLCVLTTVKKKIFKYKCFSCFILEVVSKQVVDEVKGMCEMDCPRRVYEVRREKYDTGVRELPTL